MSERQQLVGSARWRQILKLGEQLLAENRNSPHAPDDDNKMVKHHDLIVETAARLFAGHASLWLSQELLSIHTPLAVPEFISPAPPSELMRLAQERCLVCAQSETGQMKYFDEAPDLIASEDFRSVAAPLVAENAETNELGVLGVIQINRPEGPPFNTEEAELLEGLAVQVSIALQTDHQMAIERWRIQQLSLVRQVSEQIANLRDLDELARRITQLILDTFDYYYVGIFTLEPGEDVLHFRHSAGPARNAPHTIRQEGGQNESAEEDLSPVRSIHLGEGLIGRVAETGQEIVANDVNRDPRYRYLAALPETHSEVCIPLKIEERVLGVLDVQSDQPHDFHETDMLVLRALAGTIAIAIEGAHLYNALRSRAEQLSAIYDVTNAITSILDLDELLTEVVTVIQKRFGYSFVHIYDVHPGRRKIFYQAGTSPVSSSLRESGFAYDLDDPHGIVPWVARHGETLLANDVELEPRYRPSIIPPHNTRSELTVPLIFGGEVLGILDAQSDQPYAFGEDDRFLFEALADNIAVAMRNAYLYRSELWRRQVADSLLEVAGLLSADADLDQVLGSILAELNRTLPCDVAAIWLLDEEGLEEITGDELPRLRLAAVHGESPVGVDFHTWLDSSDWIDEDDAEALADFARSVSWLAEALVAEQPIIRSPQSPHDPLAAALDFPPDYSAIITPLRVGDHYLGVLTMAHHLTGRYGTEAQAMTAAFASYAAVAIENTRLYESAHEQAWVSTVLLQVAEATQTLNNLNELLATVVRITPMLVGVKACALYVVDEDGSFVPAAAFGLGTDQQAEFERWRFAPGDMKAFDQLLQQKQPVVLVGEAEDPLLVDILFSQPAEADQTDYLTPELLVLVPLLAQGEVIGALLVDYSANYLEGGSLSARFDERLAILQGIAHQTAIAVENIRLIKAQKEEAYISVALLQVAQAVVSSNNLQEILGSIVRITPILVGIKRAIIYLRDESLNGFRLAEGYGLPRSSEGYIFHPNEFPILDAVYRKGSLVAHPFQLWEGSQDEEDILEAWRRLSAPDQPEVEEYLENAASLLLAFPLSVKGEVLGVLLVEEPDPVDAESFSGLGVNRRLREKRLEIMTGICQQTALAIQNDRLQREMLERERLEREMQLARDIQRAFLPHRLPELPGWELNVRWRTAREVGGDFYDFFEVDERGDGPHQRRLGMLIADVADKGMPAALFMTLTRTLVRATVQEIASPDQVLARVNDVLVPDAQQGMFVTLFYGLLSVDTGEITYANAGHNPPFLLRHRTGQIERLEKGGMALGVLDGSRVATRTVKMEPGDYLILYTDGVTETFSPEEEMFGESGLRRAIQQANARSAQEMLDGIDHAVANFLKAGNLSDDFTLMVLHCKAD